MGLTIHYDLRSSLTKPAEVRAFVEALRQFARDLPFQKVGDLIEFRGKDTGFDPHDRDDENRWFKIQARGFLREGNSHHDVPPRHTIGFTTWPGEGCEPANFGLCQYPRFLSVPAATGRMQRLATELDGWLWSSFCKTQYASDPKCGGIENFLRCHLCVVKLLDFARSTGRMTVEVRDESEYWDNRSPEKLAREVGQWNEFVAAFSGMFKDAAGDLGMVTESAIAGFANFEHLEAAGRARLEALLARRRQSNS
jgi:hypothetical protein